MNETDYTTGARNAWVAMLSLCLRELGYEDWPVAKLAKERAEAITILRLVCEQFGDNDWPDELHLSDVIEKHLARHLQPPVGR